jgi:hypothetical protein
VGRVQEHVRKGRTKSDAALVEKLERPLRDVFEIGRRTERLRLLGEVKRGLGSEGRAQHPAVCTTRRCWAAASVADVTFRSLVAS